MHITNLTPSYSITISNVLSLSKVSNTFRFKYAANRSCGTQSVLVSQWTCNPLGVVVCTMYQPSKLFLPIEKRSHISSLRFSLNTLLISFFYAPFLSIYYHKERHLSIYCYIDFCKRKRGAVPPTSLSFRPDHLRKVLQHHLLRDHHPSMICSITYFPSFHASASRSTLTNISWISDALILKST